MTYLTYPSGDRRIRAYLAVPAGDGPWPGAVMVQDVAGLNDDLRRLADHMAANGYLVLAPDLYSGGNRIACIRDTMLTLAVGKGPTVAHIAAARDYLADRGDCTGRVGITGFCMGGQFAVLMAASGKFDAAAPNYGIAAPYLHLDQLLRDACPIIGSYGGRDRLIPVSQVRRFEGTLSALGVAHDIKVYPDATHSFFQDHHGVTGLVYRVAGLLHDPEASADAWARIFAFFGEHVGDPRA